MRLNLRSIFNLFVKLLILRLIVKGLVRRFKNLPLLSAMVYPLYSLIKTLLPG